MPRRRSHADVGLDTVAYLRARYQAEDEWTRLASASRPSSRARCAGKGWPSTCSSACCSGVLGGGVDGRGLLGRVRSFLNREGRASRTCCVRAVGHTPWP
jgi:hypothetical protein